MNCSDSNITRIATLANLREFHDEHMSKAPTASEVAAIAVTLAEGLLQVLEREKKQEDDRVAKVMSAIDREITSTETVRSLAEWAGRREDVRCPLCDRVTFEKKYSQNTLLFFECKGIDCGAILSENNPMIASQLKRSAEIAAVVKPEDESLGQAERSVDSKSEVFLTQYVPPFPYETQEESSFKKSDLAEKHELKTPKMREHVDVVDRAVPSTRFPRRNQMLCWTEAEHAISRAMKAVENAGCDKRLTDAVILLDKAQNRVADFVDNVNPDTIVFPEVRESAAEKRLTLIKAVIDADHGESYSVALNAIRDALEKQL